MKRIVDYFVTAMFVLCASVVLISCDNKDDEPVDPNIPDPAIPTVEPEGVDLGLPSGTKWATFNVGATAPEGFGLYYAFGELEPKPEYTIGNCKTYSKVLYDITGDLRYDVARVKWGWPWRIPTSSELRELREKCEWKWTTINGVNGYQVIGKNENSIFLPAGGYYKDTTSRYHNTWGYYWSSIPSGNVYASILFFEDFRYGGDSEYRDIGCLIRPVMK